MFRSLLIATLSMTTFSAVASAKGIGPRGFAMPKTFDKLAESVPRRAMTSECPDLDGTWVGTCSDSEGTSYEETTIIEQDSCKSLYWGGTRLEIGGMTTQGDSSSRYANGWTVAADWNTAGTGLKARFNMFGRGIDQDLYYSGTGSMESTLVEGRLISRSQSEMQFEVGGHLQIQRYWDECSYERQAR